MLKISKNGWRRIGPLDSRASHIQGMWVHSDFCHSLASLRINQHKSAAVKLHFTGTERDVFLYVYQLLIEISVFQLYVFDQKSNVFLHKYQIC